jgi:hypothetical protein
MAMAVLSQLLAEPLSVRATAFMAWCSLVAGMLPCAPWRGLLVSMYCLWSRSGDDPRDIGDLGPGLMDGKGA